MADCCAEIRAELTALRAEIAKLKPVDENAIVKRTEAAIIPQINPIAQAVAVGVVVQKLKPVQQALGVLDDAVYAINGRLFNLSTNVARVANRVEGAVIDAANALGISKAQQAAIGKLTGQVAQLFSLIGTIVNLALLIGTINTLGARVDAVEAGQEGLSQSISQIIGRLLPPIRGTANQAKSIAETAQGTASSALSGANTASSLASAAQSSANTAQGTATTALSASEYAMRTSVSADGKAERAIGIANAAGTALQTAINKATNAQSTADTALARANDAQATAKTAQGTATNAIGKAETAQTTGTNAKTTADRAERKAEEAMREALKKGEGNADEAIAIARNADSKANNALGQVAGIGALAGVALTIAQLALSRAGIPGPRGPQGFPGAPGRNGINGRDGRDGIDVDSSALAAIMAKLSQIQSSVNTNLGVTNLVNFKLGATSLIGGISGKLDRMSKWLHLDRLLNLLTTAATTHNAFMLSNDIGQTLLGIISNVLQLIGLKDDNGQAFDIGSVISSSIENFIKGMVGAENYQTITVVWAKANRIYQSSVNILNTFQGLASTILTGLEMTAGKIAKIGNALRKSGEVLESAYGWMNPQPKFNRVTQFLENLQNGVSTIQMVTQAPLDIINATTELTNATTELTNAIQDDSTPNNRGQLSPEPTELKTSELASKVASAGLEMLDLDLEADD